MNEIGIAHTAAVDWASFCREICLISFVEKPEQLGGIGKTVEIDERFRVGIYYICIK
jgi:hypothetical protein